MKIKIVLFASLLIGATSFADEMGPNGDKFYEEAARFENACSQVECAAPYSRKVVYTQASHSPATTPEKTKRLKEIAFDQAQIWGDTILEGDYHSAGRTRLDEVVAYYKYNAVVGYKIKYSEKAWYVGSCDFDGSQESLKGCDEGRIVEGSYVSADTLTYFSDEEKYASFTSEKQ